MNEAAPPNRLKELREASGLERRDLAVALGVTEDRVRQLEKPATRIRTQQAEVLAALLEVTPAYLVGWESKPETGKAAA